VESAIHEAPVVEDRIGLARLTILERLVAPASPDRNDEDALLDALDALRAIEWEQLSNSEEHRYALAG
jgi:hypothetical protein